MALTLSTFAGDFRALKALIAAEYNGVTINNATVELGKDNVKPEFLAKNPTGKLPFLETAQGVLFESSAIARYVARIRRDTELLGRSFFEAGQVDAWVDFASHDVELPATLWVYPILGWSKYNDAVHAKAVEDLHAALATLERHLLSRTFVVGEAVTLADIVLVAALFYPFKLVLDGSVREAYPSVTRWFYTCVNQPAFAAVLGDVPLCHEALVATGGSTDAAAKAVKGAAAAGGAGKAEAKPKAEKKAAEPKAEKPKAAKAEKAPAAEEDSGMPDIPKEVKAKNPLELLPKSAFNLDEWKRHYSNTKPHIEAMPWFWEKMDREGWSLWKQDYNYDAENTRDYATSNLVGGFIQRAEEMRRWAFGQMYVLNATAPYAVKGMWLLRGQDIKPMLDSNPDAEYYTWTKMDPSKEEDRKVVDAFWAEPAPEEKLFDAVVYDSRVFK